MYVLVALVVQICLDVLSLLFVPVVPLDPSHLSVLVDPVKQLYSFLLLDATAIWCTFKVQSNYYDI